MKYLEKTTFLTADDFISEFNKHRLANKNQWIFAGAQVGGKKVRVKSFNTSIQIFEVDGVRCPSTYDMSVGDWKAHLKNLDRILTKGTKP